ncbi:hypothetical protein WJX72_010975 [[Myrmecia] bisecta]|uniref:RNA polymerase I-specific transcription initiation factor RRN3 n=1 Tax=[Myrmecia] bisecta TaxID=41462 RepID=A0AAW1Q4L2_9CHLO
MTAALPGEADFTDLEGAEADNVLRGWLAAALQAKSSGDDATTYNHLVKSVNQLKRYSGPGADECDLINLLRQLTACISLLHEQRHQNLLSQILDVPIWKCSPELRSTLLDFITHLVVANGNMVQLCLQMLTYSIVPAPKPPELAVTAGEPWVPDAHAAAVQDEVIAAMVKILLLVPTAPSRLLPLLERSRPHKLRERESQCMYLRAVFALSESPAGASICESLLGVVVDHLVSVDVEIKWEDIMEAPTDEAFEEEGCPSEDDDIFAMAELEQQQREAHAHLSHLGGDAAVNDPVVGLGGWEGAAATSTPAAAQADKPAVDETADKLDSMMELTLEHLQRRCQAGQLGQTWRSLLVAFERAMLPTHRSKFTQYLIFYLCQQAPEHCSQTFAQLLLERLSDVRQAPITRSACAAYLASFLARARYVPEATVVRALEHLANWCLRYCQDQDRRLAASLASLSVSGAETVMGGILAPGVQHQVFYAACQALLYILCYHLEPLLLVRPPPGAVQDSAAHAEQPLTHRKGSEAQAIRALFAQVMPQLLLHRLAPLAVCVPSVVKEFTEQVTALRLMDCSQLLPPGAGGRDKGERQQRPLEMFFPFDPFLLKRSERFLDTKSTYVRWQKGHARSVAQAGMDSDDSDSSSDDDESTAVDEDLEDKDSSGVSSSKDGSDSEDDEIDSGGGSPDFLLLPRPRPVPSGFPRPVPIGKLAGQRAGSLGSNPASDEVLESYSTEGLNSPASIGASPFGMSPLSAKPYVPTNDRTPMSCTPITGFHLQATRTAGA